LFAQVSLLCVLCAPISVPTALILFLSVGCRTLRLSGCGWTHLQPHTTEPASVRKHRPWATKACRSKVVPTFRGIATSGEIHGATYFPRSACSSAFFPWGQEPRRIQEASQDHDEKCLGTRRPHQGRFPLAHGLALAEAGHEVQIFLLAEATSLMRKSMVNAILPVGWPPLSETLEKVVARHVPIFA
jgi:hypothetical protein